MKKGCRAGCNLVLSSRIQRRPACLAYKEWCRRLSSLQDAARKGGSSGLSAWHPSFGTSDVLQYNWDSRLYKSKLETEAVRTTLSEVLEGDSLPTRTQRSWVASGHSEFYSGTDFEVDERVSRREGSPDVGISSKACEEGQLNEVVELLDLLVGQGFYVPAGLFYHALKVCRVHRDLALGKRVHALTLKSGFDSNVFLANHILRMYAFHGRLHEALQVFSNLAAPSTFMWASIILAHAENKQPEQAIDLYRKMRQCGVQPNDHTFVAVLKACTKALDLASGKEVHADAAKSAVEPNVFVGNCLVDMYAKCGSLEDAHFVFDKMPTKDVVTWNAMLAGYAQHGLGQEALALYKRMEENAINPTLITFVCVLKACASIEALAEGQDLESKIKERGLNVNVVIGNSLVDMYAKCGSLVDARRVFDGLCAKDVITWNAMIAGYAEHGQCQEALSLFSSMQKDKVSADYVTFVALLKACANCRALNEGKVLHAQIQKFGLDANVVVGSSLIDMYTKCGSLEDARTVFDRMTSRDVVTWTAMIAGYADHGLGHEALKLFANMEQESLVIPNHVTFVCLLKACANIGALNEGKHLHSQIQGRELDTDMVVGSCLVDMYVKCGSLDNARKAFDKLTSRSAVTWTCMIAGYAEHGFGREALALYASMQQQGISVADAVSYICLLKACAELRALNEGKQLHCQIQASGLEDDVDIGNSLVDMYAKCGDLLDAYQLFSRLQTRDVGTWNAMIAGYVQHGLCQEALALYATMQRENINPADRATFVCLISACASVGALHQGKQLHLEIQRRGLEAEVVIGNSLVDMYAKCASLEDAQKVFDRLPFRNVVTWNALLNGYAQHRKSRLALQCFQEMLDDGPHPNETTFLILLVACSYEGLVCEGEMYFTMMVEEFGLVPNVYHQTSMVDLLGRSGNLNEAERMLLCLPPQDRTVGWRSLLSACKIHGNVEIARRCFDQIVQVEPQDAAAYILLANIYATAGMGQDAAGIESLRKCAGAHKKPASAWIEVNSNVHTFVVGEDRDDITNKLKSLNVQLREEGGHAPHVDVVLKCVSDREKEDALCGHAEKLALAYGLLHTSVGTPLLVTKNLRMCSDCHSSTKIMSRIENREIIVRDSHCVHRFVNGFCSCGDRQ